MLEDGERYFPEIDLTYEEIKRDLKCDISTFELTETERGAAEHPIDLKRAMETEGSLKEQIRLITEQTKNAIRDAILSGVKRDEGDGVKTAMVPISVVAQHGFVFSPEYYIPEAQAETVEKYLANSKTITDLVSRIRGIVDSGVVPANGMKHRLNPNTIDVLSGIIKDI